MNKLILAILVMAMPISGFAGELATSNNNIDTAKADTYKWVGNLCKKITPQGQKNETVPSFNLAKALCPAKIAYDAMKEAYAKAKNEEVKNQYIGKYRCKAHYSNFDDDVFEIRMNKDGFLEQVGNKIMYVYDEKNRSIEHGVEVKSSVIDRKLVNQMFARIDEYMIKERETVDGKKVGVNKDEDGFYYDEDGEKMFQEGDKSTSTHTFYPSSGSQPAKIHSHQVITLLGKELVRDYTQNCVPVTLCIRTAVDV